MMTEEMNQALTAFIRSEKVNIPRDKNTTFYDALRLDVYEVALAALTQPASPELKLPDGWVAVPLEPTEEMIAAGDRFMDGLSRLGDAYDSMLEAAPAVPHTAPIEPICATGGAEWVKCTPETMPEELGRYWCYVEEQNCLGKSHYQWNCSWNGDVWSDRALTGRVTHWMPLPAAPED